MTSTSTIVIALTGAVAFGVLLGYYLRWLVSLGKKGSMELTIKQILLDAKAEAQRLTEDAEKKAQERLEEVKAEEREKLAELKRTEERLIKKDELLDKRQTDLDKEIEETKAKIQEVENTRERAEKLEASKKTELERIAGLTEEAAKHELVSAIERASEEDFVVRMQKLEREGQEKLDRKAKDILTSVVQRLASSTASSVMSTTVEIPSDDIKGKIIGKEGRNIRAFERASGVEVLIDDTPGSIVLSAFDPVRRQIAKLALETLITDGRIQPARIEETVAKAQGEINKIIKENGERAAYETGVFNLDPRLIAILGRLHFRTSYGQNVLQHSIEMAHLAGMLAEELGADVAVSKAGALLHDIGKAIDHEVAGTHVDIGRRILQKFNVDPRVIQAMQSHHEEYPYETIESIIVQTVDALSAGRPGARRDSVENYLKRLGDLEAIANGFEGVEKSYAIQAGREIRVFVRPERLTDLEAQKLAREIAKKVEEDLKYPGEIKVVVIRELRTIEFAR